jgi:hypothetical protein
MYDIELISIKIGIKEPVVTNGHEYQMKSGVLGELKPRK